MFTGCTALKNYNFTAGTGVGADYTNKNTSTPWYAVVRNSSDITVSFGTGINSIGAHMFDGCNYAPSAITSYGSKLQSFEGSPSTSNSSLHTSVYSFS